LKIQRRERIRKEKRRGREEKRKVYCISREETVREKRASTAA